MAQKEIVIATGNIRGSRFQGHREDYYYDVPEGTIALGFHTSDNSPNALTIGSGNGEATLNWTKGEKKAHVHAWVNGTIGSPNEISWKIVATMK